MPKNELAKVLKLTGLPKLTGTLISKDSMRIKPEDYFLTLPQPKMLLIKIKKTSTIKHNIEPKVSMHLGMEKSRSSHSHRLPRECDLSSFSDRETRRVFLNWAHSQHALHTKILFAAQWGFTEYLDKLLKKNKVNLNKAGALYLSALSARLDTVKHLVEQHNADVNYCDENPLFDLPLHGAISSGNVSCVSYLLSKGASVEAKGGSSNNAVEHCLDYGSLLKDSNKYAILETLVKRGASLDTYLPSREISARAYLEAKKKKHPAITKYITKILSLAPCSVETESTTTRKRRCR